MKRFNRKLMKVLIIIILILTVVLIGVSVYSFARYASKTVWNYYLKSQNFYFESTLRTDYVDNMWNGEDVKFNISNYIGSDVTEGDIKYNVTCEVLDNDDASCLVNDSTEFSGVLTGVNVCVNRFSEGDDVSSLSREECLAGEHKWESVPIDKEMYFNVVSESLIDAVSVKIVVKAVEPFSKSISGTYVLNKSNLEENDLLTSLVNRDNYSRLTITNNTDIEKNIDISWDPVNLNISGNVDVVSRNDGGFINKVNVVIGAYESVSYVYYRSNSLLTPSIKEFLINVN